MLATVRVQEKGQVTIPSDIRKRLQIKKGDLVTFIVQDENVMLKPVEMAVQELLSRLDQHLNAGGRSLDDLLAVCRRKGGETAAREFGLGAEEKAELFLALQLQAEQALEEIRAQAHATGADQLSDEEINAEIQAARVEASRSNRT
jgi:AbrB family looped-hinge helix DNA binding protein